MYPCALFETITADVNTQMVLVYFSCNLDTLPDLITAGLFWVC